METLEGIEVWAAENVFPKWAAAYPQPPGVIGVTRKYFPEVDAPVKAACAALTRSVAQEHKQGIKTTLKHLGWKGFKMDGLTPNMTRRAQVANWLLYYRRELRGVSIEGAQAEAGGARRGGGRRGVRTRPRGPPNRELCRESVEAPRGFVIVILTRGDSSRSPRKGSSFQMAEWGAIVVARAKNITRFLGVGRGESAEWVRAHVAAEPRDIAGHLRRLQGRAAHDGDDEDGTIRRGRPVRRRASPRPAPRARAFPPLNI